MRDAATAKMMADPNALKMSKNLPFDGQRMIFAGFDAVVPRSRMVREGAAVLDRLV